MDWNVDMLPDKETIEMTGTGPWEDSEKTKTKQKQKNKV
jgi:hypothetical protein